ncbi:MAG TPA: ankyrin repeat domain-containing protein [Arcobacter sp.]|nr:ankyrin repeat domain-containing protein [Arcobacter sp.]
MFESILNKFVITPVSFVQELYKKELNIQVLDKMINAKKFSINYQDSHGETFLHLCILKNKFKSAKYLISKHIDVSLRNKKDEEPIVASIGKNNHLLVEIILKAKNININQLDKDGRSLLQNVVLAGSTKTVEELIKNSIDVKNKDNTNRDVMFDAISYGCEDIIDSLLELDDIELNTIDSFGDTILHKEESLRNEKLCIKLIEKGSDPTLCDRHGHNLLYHTAIKGMEGSRLLDIAIEHGYNINATVKNNNTLLMEALSIFYKLPEDEVDRRESLLKMAKNLVSKGVDVNAINNDGENSLFDAVRNNNYNGCAFLLNEGVDINKQNNSYQTPLLLACYMGMDSIDIILLLLQYEANAGIKNDDSYDVLEVLNTFVLHNAKYKELADDNYLKHYKEDGKYLLVLKDVLDSTKVDLRNKDSYNQPLFFEPLLHGHFDLFYLYMSNGFDINEKDEEDKNIFYRYVQSVFSLNEYFEYFRTVVLGMVNLHVDINMQDSDGKNIFSKILTKDSCPKLFEDLIVLSNFKYDTNTKCS